MSEGALDLSLPPYEVNAQRPSRSHDQVSSDSGRASSDSTSSDIHEDIKPRFQTRTSPPRMVTSSPTGGIMTVPPPPSGHIPHSDPSSSADSNTQHLGPRYDHRNPVPFPPHPRLRNLPPNTPQQHPHTTSTTSNNIIVPSSSPPLPQRLHSGEPARLSNPNSPQASSSLHDEDLKPLPHSSNSERGGSDPRVAPIRPFKMYPVDAFNVYNSQLMSGSGSGLSPSPVGIQSLYDSVSPSNFPSFPLTPLTSHLLQRKRRAELRETANNASTFSGKSESSSPVTTVPNSSSPNHLGNTYVSTSLSTKSNSDSDAGQENDGDLEKKAKLGPDERKDDAYWDRRRKNNEAAKRSRDARRQKEEEIAMRAAFLEQENLKLRAQVAILKNETAKLHYMLYNRI